MTVVHVLTNRTSRSPELMHELRRLWRLIDTLGIDLSVRYIPTDANTMADALSRGAPTDELTLTDAAFFELDRRWGPHTIDQYASAANARLPRFHTAFPDAKGLGAGAMAHDWSGENNYAFPPLAELPRVAQLLFERPSIAHRRRAVLADAVVPAARRRFAPRRDLRGVDGVHAAAGAARFRAARDGRRNAGLHSRSRVGLRGGGRTARRRATATAAPRRRRRRLAFRRRRRLGRAPCASGGARSSATTPRPTTSSA